MATAAPNIDRFKVVENPGQQQERDKEATLESRLLKTVGEYYDLTKMTRPRRYYLWLMADLFAKGIHFVFYDPFRGAVEEWSAEKVDRCMYTPVPLLQYAVEVIAAQYTTSNGRAIPMPTDNSDPKMKVVARSLQDYADYLDWLYYKSDPAQRQFEAKLIPLRGIYNFVEYDKSAGPKIQMPQYAPETKQLCADCGYEVEGGQDGTVGVPSGGDANRLVSNTDPLSLLASQGGPQEAQGAMGMDAMGATDGSGAICPHCGSENIAPMTTGVQSQGQTETRQGAVKRHVVDPFQVEIYDRRRGVEESKHLIYDEILFKSEAKKAYPWLKVVQGQASLGSYEQGFLGLHYLSQLQILISNTGRLDQSQPSYIDNLGPSAFTLGYYGSFLHDMLCWRRRAWLDAEVYADWPTDETKWTQLPGTDQLIPPGTKVVEMFPDGMCIHIINGDKVVQVENQDKNKVWSYCGYRLPSAGTHGTGVNSLISLNRGYDEAHSYGMQALLMSALGILLVDERVKRIENVPGRSYSIPIDARMPNEPVASLAARIDMGGSTAIMAAEPIKESIRGHIGDLSMAANPQGFGNRPSGVGKETATAARYNAGATNTLTSPPMELYAAHRARVIEQVVELERVHNLRPRLYGKVGETAAQWFDPMQIPEDVKFGVVEESWRPRTMETQREDIAGAIQLGVGMTAEGLSPALEEKAMHVFGLADEVDDYDDWAVLAEQRLDAMKAAVPAVMQEMQQVEMELQSQPVPVDPMTGAPLYDPAMRLIEIAQAAPRPLDLPGHQHYCRFYVERYQMDEFQSYPPVLQEAVEKLFLMHQQGIGQAGAIQTEQQVMAQEPAMQAQQQMQQEQQAGQAEQEQQRAAQEGQQAQEDEGAAREHESGEKEADHDRGIEAKREEHKMAMELQAAKHKQALEIEKVRASNRPKPQNKAKGKR